LAEPYRANGFNVRVFDSRATGFSDGKYYALGGREYRDVLKWGELLHDKLGNSKVFLHGICIGSATAIYTLTSENCPAYFAGMCADGMYKNFFETFKEHMIERNKPVFPVCYQVMLLLYINTGTRAISYGPYKAVKSSTDRSFSSTPTKTSTRCRRRVKSSTSRAFRRKRRSSGFTRAATRTSESTTRRGTTVKSECLSTNWGRTEYGNRD
jgi:hypothetical protein